MYRSTSRWLCVCLWLGCAAPEDKNPAVRCSLDSDCPGLQECYRGYCLGDADGVVPDDAWSGSAEDDDAGTTSEVPAVGAPKDAVAPPVVQTDAGSAGGASSSPADGAATPPAQAPAAMEPAATAPTSEPAGSPGSSGTQAPTTQPTTPKSDAGATPATPPPAAQQPESPPSKAPPPSTEPPAEPPAESGSLLGALIESGLAPRSMLVCVPSCLVISRQSECERCIERVLMKERGENPCAEVEPPKSGAKVDPKKDDKPEERPSPNDPLCAVWTCARGTCRGGS